jgi:hypothetical protein
MTIRSPNLKRSHPFARAVTCASLALLADAGCGSSTLDLFNPDLGLLAHWAFDESEPGSTVADSSGFGLHATPSANPPTPSRDVPPVHFPDPYSLSFDGQDQWANAGNPILLNAGGPISIAAWVRASNVSDYRNILAHGWRIDPNFDVSLRIRDGNYEFTYWDTVDHVASAPIGGSDLGVWVHLCGVFDGSEYRIYRNGALAASRADTTVAPANIDAPWAIGGRAPQPDGLGRVFAGLIDDLRVYGRALSAAEVEALYRR